MTDHPQPPSPPPPIAHVPAAWAAIIPQAGAAYVPTSGPAGGAPVAVPWAPSVPLADLTERLRATAKGKAGDHWIALRRAAQGERMFRIQGGPGDPSLPLIAGVDEFVSKSVLFHLAASDASDGTPWHTVPPADVAAMLDPAFAHLRADVAALGGVSKFDRAHVAEKWSRVCEKIAAERAHAADFMARLTRTSAEAQAAALPPLVQLDGVFFVLDDRSVDRPAYEGPLCGAAVVPLARQLWAEAGPAAAGRVLDVPLPKGGTRPMLQAEAIQAYGRSVTQLVTDYSATRPRLEDLTLVRPAVLRPPPAPAEDPDVAAWLATLAGPQLPALIAWLAHASPARLTATCPALVMVGGAHVGKSLLAQGVAHACGLEAPAPLGRVLGRFASMLQSHPIVFSDEGLPRGPGGQPLTEEFRDLVTRSNHALELKGMDRPVVVRGGVRVILAANRIDRLFRSTGTLGPDDVAALVRRLLVIDVGTGTDSRVLQAGARARALGAFEGDPARLARVAGHVRWIQEQTPAPPPPEPGAAPLQRELRRGSDASRAALESLEDGSHAGVDWIAFDPTPLEGAPGGIVWARPEPWALRATMHGPVLSRAVATYTVRANTAMRRHPVTGEPTPGGGRQRWVGLSMALLTQDGISLSLAPPAEA